MKYVQNLTGSLSPSSSESHVTQCGLCGIHSLNQGYFPNPAGAAIKVSFLSSPSSELNQARRETKFFHGRGMNSFVFRSSTIGTPIVKVNACFGEGLFKQVVIIKSTMAIIV